MYSNPFQLCTILTGIQYPAVPRPASGLYHMHHPHITDPPVHDPTPICTIIARAPSASQPVSGLYHMHSPHITDPPVHDPSPVCTIITRAPSTSQPVSGLYLTQNYKYFINTSQPPPFHTLLIMEEESQNGYCSKQPLWPVPAA